MTTGQFSKHHKNQLAQTDRVAARAARMLQGKQQRYLASGALYTAERAHAVEGYLADKCKTKLTFGEVIARCSKEPGHNDECWPVTLMKLAEVTTDAEPIPDVPNRGMGW